MSISAFPRLPLLLLFASIFVATPAHSEFEASKTNFKACIDGNLTAEKKKAKPKVDAIVTKCKSEYNAFVADLPPSVRDQVVHDIKDKIKKKLK